MNHLSLLAPLHSNQQLSTSTGTNYCFHPMLSRMIRKTWYQDKIILRESHPLPSIKFDLESTYFGRNFDHGGISSLSKSL